MQDELEQRGVDAGMQTHDGIAMMISIMLRGSLGGGAGDRAITGLTSTGSNAGVVNSNRPARNSRRHLNSILALMPFC